MKRFHRSRHLISRNPEQVRKSKPAVRLDTFARVLLHGLGKGRKNLPADRVSRPPPLRMPLQAKHETLGLGHGNSLNSSIRRDRIGVERRSQAIDPLRMK